MKTIICLFALISIIAASAINPRVASDSLPVTKRVAREAVAPPVASAGDASNQNAAAAKDDLDNAETFGFGFHKHVHVHGGHYGPAYYPHPGYYPYAGYHGYGYGHPYYY